LGGDKTFVLVLKTTAMSKESMCLARLTLSGALIVLALFRCFRLSLVFSGDAIMYYRLVRVMLRFWLITGSFAAVAAVVVVPVFWQGSRWQLPLAGAFFTLAALLLLVCMSGIHQY
jgi:hypothetical protein